MTHTQRRSSQWAGLAAAAALALTVSALGTSSVPAEAAPRANKCGIVFDDFNYSSSADSALTDNGWIARGGAGGPGIAGTWSPEAITFTEVDGATVAQMASSTDGTLEGTVQTELFQSERRFFEGTYASRIRFSDAPVTGEDGDLVVQTFFTISPSAGPMDPTYSELDFAEYLPNGGWGEPEQTMLQTSWHTFIEDPWYADNAQGKQHGSLDGWHDIVAQVKDGHVKYYIDGVLTADHTGKYYPRQNMSVNFNLWFINLTGHVGTENSTYIQQIDWFSYTKNKVISPEQATAAAAAYQAKGVGHVDTLGAGVNCGR